MTSLNDILPDDEPNPPPPPAPEPAEPVIGTEPGDDDETEAAEDAASQ